MPPRAKAGRSPHETLPTCRVRGSTDQLFVRRCPAALSATQRPLEEVGVPPGRSARTVLRCRTHHHRFRAVAAAGPSGSRSTHPRCPPSTATAPAASAAPGRPPPCRRDCNQDRCESSPARSISVAGRRPAEAPTRSSAALADRRCTPRTSTIRALSRSDSVPSTAILESVRAAVNSSRTRRHGSRFPRTGSRASPSGCRRASGSARTHA